MPTHIESRPSPYSPQQLCAMVLDIERYPEFLPWCRAARVLSREGNTMLAELVISFKGITESYASNVVHTSDDTGEHIAVSLVRGPFKSLENQWHFVPSEEGGSTIDFALEFHMKYRWMDNILGALFGKATEKMVSAFSTRAEKLFQS